jgi:hypothetical protein
MIGKRFLRAAALTALLYAVGCESWCERHYGLVRPGIAGYPAYQPCCVPCCPPAGATTYAPPVQQGYWNQPACQCPPPIHQQ